MFWAEMEITFMGCSACSLNNEKIQTMPRLAVLILNLNERRQIE